MSHIGQPLSRVDGRLKVTGAARYTGISPSLEWRTPRSSTTIANGRTVSIDAGAAERAPGVAPCSRTATCRA